VLLLHTQTTLHYTVQPLQDNIQSSLYQLWVLGALGNTGDLTVMGRKMVEFPLDPPLAKMLLFSEKLGCTAEVCPLYYFLLLYTIMQHTGCSLCVY
jgi:HrpA-like RNA helicase